MENLIILGIGVSLHKTDGVLRFEHFCKKFNLPYQIIGEGKAWRGGDMSVGTGGGQKINELLNAIEKLDNRLLIVCDTFDLFPIATKEEIIDKFYQLCDKDKVIFSTEIFCWPDKSLSSLYPKSPTKYKFLNSGSFIGYRDRIYDLIKGSIVQNTDDDQLFFTHQFLSSNNIVLDYHCHLFQTLTGCQQDIIIHKNRIYNRNTQSYPIFIHGNGNSKLFLNYIENYISTDLTCNYSIIMNWNYRKTQQKSSLVFMALYIDSTQKNELFSFMKSISRISYDNKILFFYDRSNDNNIKHIIKVMGHKYKPNVTGYVYQDFIKSEAHYYFLLEQNCIISKIDIIQDLLSYFNEYRRIISPMLTNHTIDYIHSHTCTSSCSNFWGDLDHNGYYKESDNYSELILGYRRDLWNVPYVYGAIMFSREIIHNWKIDQKNKFTTISPSMELCFNLRKNTLFMYMSNYYEYGSINKS